LFKYGEGKGKRIGIATKSMNGKVPKLLDFLAKVGHDNMLLKGVERAKLVNSRGETG